MTARSRALDGLELWRSRASGAIDAVVAGRPSLSPATRASSGETRVVYDDDGPRPRARFVLADEDFVPEAGASPASDRDDADAGDARHDARPDAAVAPDAARAPDDVWGAGDRVWHAQWGAGTVVSLRGTGRMRSALVRFDQQRSPRLVVVRFLRAETDASA
mgnify:CR=1 FL=1